MVMLIILSVKNIFLKVTESIYFGLVFFPETVSMVQLPVLQQIILTVKEALHFSLICKVKIKCKMCLCYLADCCVDRHFLLSWKHQPVWITEKAIQVQPTCMEPMKKLKGHQILMIP